MLSEQDSIEAIAEDAQRLHEAYITRERYPFSGMVQLLGDAVAHRVYLMGWIVLFERIAAIEERKRVQSMEETTI